MCDACYEPGELAREALGGAIAEARAEMGPLYPANGMEEPEWVARYVKGWHDALNYLEKKAGLA